MTNQKWVFSPPSLLKQRAQKRFGFVDPDAGPPVCFQFRVIPGTRRSLSKNRQREDVEGKGGKGGGGERRGLWVMSTRCLTFAGSHILWSSGWCVICA